MKIKFKLSVEIRRSQPEPCQRRHAGDPPPELPSVTDACVELARGFWDHDVRSPLVGARFGFSQPAASRAASTAKKGRTTARSGDARRSRPVPPA